MSDNSRPRLSPTQKSILIFACVCLIAAIVGPWLILYDNDPVLASYGGRAKLEKSEFWDVGKGRWVESRTYWIPNENPADFTSAFPKLRPDVPSSVWHGGPNGGLRITVNFNRSNLDLQRAYLRSFGKLQVQKGMAVP